jgi:hypothetical protein
LNESKANNIVFIKVGRYTYFLSDLGIGADTPVKCLELPNFLLYMCCFLILILIPRGKRGHRVEKKIEEETRWNSAAARGKGDTTFLVTAPWRSGNDILFPLDPLSVRGFV